jgi:oxygen-dependent protoporphyrinogen oxidase
MGQHIHTGARVEQLGVVNGKIKAFTGGTEFEVDGVILATPADKAAGILQDTAPRSSALLSQIPYSPMAVVGIGYDLDDLSEPPNGFGYLIPKVENRKILGALWTSSIFPGHRSPDDRFLIRVMTGGARDHETPFLPEEELLATVKGEIAATMGLTAEPSFFTVIRWKEAIPLYTVGHLDRLDEAECSLPPGIVLAGNAYRGVGINDCVREAEVAAQKVLEALSQA